MKFKPTPEQQAIVEAARNSTASLMVTAYAGCAKTTTLEMLAAAIPPQATLALAFNVKIKKELEKRFPSHVTVLTLNGLGHRAWASAIGKRLTLEEKKLGNILGEACKKYPALWPEWQTMRQTISSAMQAGLVPAIFPAKSLVPDDPTVWEDLAFEHGGLSADALFVARDALVTSVRQSFGQGCPPTISFDDQIYMSCMFGGVFPRYPLVLVDEAQDLSPLNHLQVRKASAGRLIVVGDPKQAIYAFRGADSASMDKLRALRPEWIDLPLATTFRCPKVVVARQQDHAPGFTAAPGNLEGKFGKLLRKLTKDDLEIIAPDWDWPLVEACMEPGQKAAVLCRNNAPLLALAFKLIRAGTGVHMLGRDIGKGLVALSKKILKQDDLPAEQCRRLILEWQQKELSLAEANDKQEKITGITDRAECLLAVLEGGSATSGALRSSLEDLFSRDGGVTLATGHKAKGLEWDLVVHLDPWRVPSKWAQKKGGSALEQEKNLRYVIETRTRSVLLTANLEDFQ